MENNVIKIREYDVGLRKKNRVGGD